MDKERDRRERELINDAIKLWASQYNEENRGEAERRLDNSPSVPCGTRIPDHIPPT